jgi:hypothetical protein
MTLSRPRALRAGEETLGGRRTFGPGSRTWCPAVATDGDGIGAGMLARARLSYREAAAGLAIDQLDPGRDWDLGGCFSSSRSAACAFAISAR